MDRGVPVRRIAMDERSILLDIDGPLARITLNRPSVLNAENLAWVEGLGEAVAAVAARPDVRVVLLRGAGGAFCAGMDRDMLSRHGMPAGFYEGQEQAFRALEQLDKITLAALHGYCLGGGLQLAVACDIRICSTDCRLGLPAGELGLFPGMAVYRLPRLIGLGPARRIILHGDLLEPDAALRLGLVDHLVPAERWEAGVEEIVAQYLAAPRAASVATKRLMAHAFGAPFEAVYEESRSLLAECLASPEAGAATAEWQQRRGVRQ
jgi:enoyl-CoA hydratase/carnithine racemase